MLITKMIFILRRVNDYIDFIEFFKVKLNFEKPCYEIVRFGVHEGDVRRYDGHYAWKCQFYCETPAESEIAPSQGTNFEKTNTIYEIHAMLLHQSKSSNKFGETL